MVTLNGLDQRVNEGRISAALDFDPSRTRRAVIDALTRLAELGRCASNYNPAEVLEQLVDIVKEHGIPSPLETSPQSLTFWPVTSGKRAVYDPYEGDEHRARVDWVEAVSKGVTSRGLHDWWFTQIVEHGVASGEKWASIA